MFVLRLGYLIIKQTNAQIDENSQSNANVSIKNNKLSYILINGDTPSRSRLHLLLKTHPMIAHPLSRTTSVCERFEHLCSRKMKSETIFNAFPIHCCRLMFPDDRIARCILSCQDKRNIHIELKVASLYCLLFRWAGTIKLQFCILDGVMEKNDNDVTLRSTSFVSESPIILENVFVIEGRSPKFRKSTLHLPTISIAILHWIEENPNKSNMMPFFYLIAVADLAYDWEATIVLPAVRVKREGIKAAPTPLPVFFFSIFAKNHYITSGVRPLPPRGDIGTSALDTSSIGASSTIGAIRGA